jgi:diaminohydroxyphosphoribosylaminopyrimidine deaminase/5-amino-6-(5-phosphoribosylamino)uracil reductase
MSGALLAVERLALPVSEDGLSPTDILKVLGARECNEILLESGPTLAGAMLQSGLVDQLIVYMAPVLLGSRARPLLTLPLDHMAEAYRFDLVDHRRIGSDQRFVFEPRSGLETPRAD